MQRNIPHRYYYYHYPVGLLGFIFLGWRKWCLTAHRSVKTRGGHGDQSGHRNWKILLWPSYNLDDTISTTFNLPKCWATFRVGFSFTKGPVGRKLVRCSVILPLRLASKKEAYQKEIIVLKPLWFWWFCCLFRGKLGKPGKTTYTFNYQYNYPSKELIYPTNEMGNSSSLWYVGSWEGIPSCSPKQLGGHVWRIPLWSLLKIT